MKNIESYLQFTITDLKRLGFIGGGVRLGRLALAGNSIGIVADSENEQVTLVFCCNGIRNAQPIRLHRQKSNLTPNDSRFYYYFICPKSGALCRKLYFVNGVFVGRKSFRHIYEKQANRRHRKHDSLIDYLSCNFDLLEPRRYRRETYNGKLTPYGRSLKKRYEKLLDLKEKIVSLQ